MNRNLTASVLIILAIGVYFTVTSSMIDDAKAVNTVNKQYISALDHAGQLISVRDEITAKYNAISPDDRARLDKMIPSTVDNIRLIIDLNSAGLKHGFTIQNIKATVPSNTAANGFPASRGQQVAGKTTATLNLSATPTSVANPLLDTVLISFSVIAGYDQFISFLRDLEANLRIMDVTHLTVSANDAGTFNFDVQVQTYWLRQ